MGPTKNSRVFPAFPEIEIADLTTFSSSSEITTTGGTGNTNVTYTFSTGAELYDNMMRATYTGRHGYLVIEKVIFNDPATIVIWKDKTKTVVKCENEAFDPEKGLAMAIAKKAFGNKGNYFNEFKKWITEKKDENVQLGKVINDPENENIFYVELPDGYRLKFENNEYVGRYDPNFTDNEKISQNSQNKNIWNAKQRLWNALHDSKATKDDLKMAMIEADRYLDDIFASDE